MAVVSKEDLLKQIKDLIGDNTSDEALKLIEDASDTLDSKASDENVEELKERIKTLEDDNKELDKTWREKYRNRFFSGDGKGKEEDPEKEEEEVEDNTEEPTEFSELFSTEN